MTKASSIRFVRQYTMYNTEVFEVIHNSNRCLSYYLDKNDGVDVSKLPTTVRKFIREHNSRTQHDSIFHRDEIIYK